MVKIAFTNTQPKIVLSCQAGNKEPITTIQRTKLFFLRNSPGGITGDEICDLGMILGPEKRASRIGQNPVRSQIFRSVIKQIRLNLHQFRKSFRA